MSKREMEDLKDQAANILVVDDELDVKALFTLRFRKEIREGKLKFCFAENGLKALQHLEADPTIELVLSDINMPEMDGLSLLNKIRESYPTVQVVMVTAYGDLENIRAAMNAGSFDFLNKPFSMSDLKVTINNALEQVDKLKAFAAAKVEKEKAQASLVINLQKMDRLKDEFLANTTHELHTPLNGMIGLAEALLGGVAGGLNEKARADLNLIVTSGQRLRMLVGDILEIAKLRHEEMRIETKPCDLSRVIHTVVSLSKPLVGTSAVDLLVDLPENLPLVMADENRLFQILHNLVGNAVKFTDLGEIRIGASLDKDRLRVFVEDTGQGIPESEQARIFNAFEQIDGSMTRSQGGTGLGLAITKQLVTLHGSDLEVTSTPDLGSRFEFSLLLASEGIVLKEKEVEIILPPALAAEPMIGTKTIMQPVALPSGTWSVLAVDDEPVNLQVLVNQLSLHGAQVDPVTDGKQALTRLNSDKKYDLVILDVMMPGLSGLEVCREIRKAHALSDLPVLMLTARNRPEDVVAGLEAGANDYLAKPFDSAELFARVKSLATLRKAVRHALHQARQLGAERKQREQLEYLRQFNRDLTSTLELRQVLQRFLDHMHDCAPHDLAFFCLKINEVFEVVAERGAQPYDVLTREVLHETCSGWSEMLRLKTEPMRFQLKDDMDRFDEVTSQTLLGTWLGMPMMNRGKVVGTFFMLRRKASRFHDREIQVGFTFVGQAALAIENARLFEQVRHLAMTDALTGLYNRRYFFMEGELAVKRVIRFQNPLSLLLLDIDHFKRFNDEHSHAVGDQVLVQLARTIKSQCRQADVAGRYGGEEIAMLMPQTDAKAAGEVAERLRKAIANEPLITAGNRVLKITVSIGVATFIAADECLDRLLGRADQALYQAKGSGRNRVVCATHDP